MPRSKLSFKDIAEQHGEALDPDDPRQRTRYRRMLDKIYERGLSEEMTAQKASEEYCARVAGKPITPVDVSGTVTEGPEELVAAIKQCLSILKGNDDRAESSTERIM